MSLFFWRGKGAVYFVPTLTNYNSPTATAVSAGTDLSKAVTGIAGFTTSLNRVATPVLAYKEDVQTDGNQTYADSSLTILDDDGTADADSTARTAAKTALGTEGTAGYIVFLRTAKTPVASGKVTVYPVKIGAVNAAYTLDNEPARTTVEFVITGSPAKDVALT